MTAGLGGNESKAAVQRMKSLKIVLDYAWLMWYYGTMAQHT